MRSPGRKPRRSPASTAGRVRMMRSTCLACSACTAMATASQDLPVPAGPDAEGDDVAADGVDVALLARWTWGGRRGRPAPRSTSAVSTSDGPLVGLHHVDGAARHAPASSGWPRLSRTHQLLEAAGRARVGVGSPVDGDLVAPHVDGRRRGTRPRRGGAARRAAPSRPTIRWLPGTAMRVGVPAGMRAGSTSVPAIVAIQRTVSTWTASRTCSRRAVAAAVDGRTSRPRWPRSSATPWRRRRPTPAPARRSCAAAPPRRAASPACSSTSPSGARPCSSPVPAAAASAASWPPSAPTSSWCARPRGARSSWPTGASRR